jgi:hypothetical protein
MSEGLTLDLDEFQCLPNNKKIDCLFQNQLTTIKLVRGWKIYFKATAWLGSFLLVGMGYLFKLHIN